MKRANIVVLSSSHPSRNPRAVKAARALAEHGHDVTLLTLRSTPRFDEADADALAGRRFSVELVDTTQPFFRSVALRGRTRIARVLARVVGGQSPSALGPANLLLNAVRRRSADLVLCHTELGLWCARQLLADKRRAAVDFEDWYSEDLLESERQHRPVKLLRSLESFALRHAEFCTAPSLSMAETLHAEHGGRLPIVVRNTFPVGPEGIRARPASSPRVRLVWFSQTIGPGRGLERFLAAWSQTRNESSITLIGDPRPGYVAAIEALVSPAKRSHLQIQPSLKPSELALRLADFDVGLALEPDQPRNKDCTISNKIFQYLNAGLAVIATHTRGQDEVFRAAPGIGRQFSPDGNITSSIDELVGNPSGIAAHQAAARAAASGPFAWRDDADRLCRAVDRALTGTS